MSIQFVSLASDYSMINPNVGRRGCLGLEELEQCANKVDDKITFLSDQQLMMSYFQDCIGQCL